MSASAPLPRTSRKQPCRYLKEQQVQPQPRYEPPQDHCEQENTKSERPVLPPTRGGNIKPVAPYATAFPCARSQEEPFSHQPKGQCVKPQCVPEASLMSSMAELVHDIIPQSANPQTVPERIEWVNIQKCSNVNDRKRVVDVIVVGLARGYQIWARMENGDCREILSERQGPLRTGLLLSMGCEPSFGIHNDRFRGFRPLFALVDENTPVPDRQCCTVSFVSLLSSQFVHKINFADSVQALAASTKVFVVSFVDHIVILDMMSLREQRTICNTQIYEGSGTPFAVSDVFLAFASSELQQEYQSCGGMGGEDVFQDSSSYSVVSVARNFTKTLTSFGNSVVSTLSASQQPKELLSSVAQPGIVTVVDVNKLPVDNINGPLQNSEYADAVVAHFVAHTEPIGFIAFGNGGQLLLTAGQSSTYFHVFLIHPHPGSSLLGAVRHLYRLYRGTTPAKVVSCSFSVDNRWLAVATNHGTTHIFGICPYGGQVTVRTHGGEIVNRESRFHRSAGLPEMGYIHVKKAAETRGHQFGGAQVCREHPDVSRCNIARSVSNPRIGPYPNPIGMEAHVRIKQRFYSADNLSAWASDMTPASLSSGKKYYKTSSKPSDQHRLAISFASNSIPNSKNTSLLVINNDGVLTEYLLSVAPAPHHGASGIFSPNIQQRPNPDETLIQCTPTAVAQWTLQRNKLSADFRAPICEQNPLWQWFFLQDVYEEKSEEEVNAKWISQIEVLTYLDPHRRLWMGPQFSFRTYIQSLEHASADLVSIITPGSNKDRLRGGITKSVPVIIEATGSLGSFDVGEPTEIIGGSWSSDLDPKGIKRQKVLEKKLEEAMHELTVDGKSNGFQNGNDGTSSDESQGSTDSSSHDSINFQPPNMDI
uniref:BCAS3 domain-containing protein n=1 Tax=Elaeophora elaphi TaxID=1147741 RepID=A0A0R3S4D9_9BILA